MGAEGGLFSSNAGGDRVAVGVGVTLPRRSCARVAESVDERCSGDELATAGGATAGATGLMSDVPDPEPRRLTRQDVL